MQRLRKQNDAFLHLMVILGAKNTATYQISRKRITEDFILKYAPCEALFDDDESSR